MSSGSRKGRTNHQQATVKQSNKVLDLREILDTKNRSHASPHLRIGHDFNSTKQGNNRSEERHSGEGRKFTHHKSVASMQTHVIVKHQRSNSRNKNGKTYTRGKSPTTRKQRDQPKTSAGTPLGSKQTKITPTNAGNRRSNVKRNESGKDGSRSRNLHKSRQTPSKDTRDTRKKSHQKQNESSRKRGRSRSNKKYQKRNSGDNSRKRSTSSSTQPPKKKTKRETNPFTRYDDRLTILLSKEPSDMIMALLNDYEAFFKFLNCDKINPKQVEKILEILSNLYETPYMHNFAKIFAGFQSTAFLKHVRRYIFHLKEENRPKPKTHLERIIRFFHELLNRFPNICEELPLELLSTYSAQWETNIRDKNNSNNNNKTNSDENEDNMKKNEGTDHYLTQPSTNVSPFNEDPGKQIRDSILKLISLRDEQLRQNLSPSNEIVVADPPDDYKSIPVFPRREDIFPDQPPFLRENIVRGRYSDVTHYLDVQFRLLREDYIAPVREGVLEAVNIQEDRARSIYVYRNVRVVGRLLDTKFGGLLHRISFDVSRMRRVNWTHSKRFKYGSLYCLIDSETIVNKAESTIYFITITDRKVDDLKKGFLNVKFLDDKLVDSIPFGKQFFMIESPAYFESYRHVLEGLQNFSKDNLPFQRYLVECNKEARPPVYLSKSTKSKNGNLLSNETDNLDDLTNSFKAEVNNGVSKRSDTCYDLSKALSCRNATSVSVLDPSSWPSKRHVDLNSSQLNALKAALTQEFVVIQGPPGTGKTFVGLRIARALLENKSIWRRRKPQKEEGRLKEETNTKDTGKHSPILVVCYTNHALDQFLEGILHITQNFVRVGGRGKSESLERFNLKQRKRITDESLCFRNLKTELKDVQLQIEEVKKVLEAANEKLNPSELEKLLNDEESEQLEQWERVASQMRVHRIEAWLKMQDERDEEIERRMKRRRPSTPSSECNETEYNTDCSNLVSTSVVAAKRQRKTVYTAIKEKCAEQPTQALNLTVEQQVIKKSSTFQTAQSTPVENDTKEFCGSQELEEGEILDSDDEMTYECNDIHAVTNEVLTRVDVDNNNLISVNYLEKNPSVEENGTFGYTIKIQAQEIPLNLSQDPKRTKSIKDDVRGENTAKNPLEERVNQLSTTWIPQSFSQGQVAISSVSMRDGNNSTMSTASGSCERSDNKLKIANKDIVIGKHSNNVRNTEMDGTSTKSFNVRNTAKVNNENEFHIMDNAGNEDNSIFDEKSLNERDKVDDAVSSEMSLSESDIDEGEIFDADDADGDDETSESVDEGRVHGIDLTTIFEPKFLLEGSKSTEKYANEENITNTEGNFEKGSTKPTPEAGQQMLFEHEAQDPDEKENEEKKYQVDLKVLSAEQRSDVYQKWRARFFEYHKKKIDSLRERHDKKLQQLSEIEGIQNEKILRNVDVIGMTTTGAAKHRLTLQEIKPRIVIVEEAAEVLEGHVITALSSGTDHLILIGDHKQLKPNPAVYVLARKYNLDVSLFERMVSNGLKCHSLSTQHRMRPEIADIMRIIYPKLVDDVSVKSYRSITGVQKNVYFIDHEHPESGNEELKSHSNQHEVDFVAALCRYLLLQGYRGNRITVLTMYTGQLLTLQRSMPQESFDGIRISSVDNFQGEESDIIILSLVRSNKTGKIGFLNVSNRVCVALSRAKQAMYCIGNISMMATGNKLWRSIKNKLQQKSLIGKSLPLCCPNHPEKKIEASSAEDFKKAPDGGCMSPCEFRLPCGHVCSLYCHSIDQKHEKYRCTETCLEELCDLKHRCQRQCHYNEACGKCKVKVSFIVPSCKHDIQIECWERDKVTCPIPCTKILDRCGHRCAGKCGEDCDSVICRKKVTRTLECGHEVSMPCSMDVEFYECREPCEKLLDCKHKCPGDCSSCKKGKFHVRCKEPCKRMLICSHECEEPCTSYCPPCRKRCRNRCNHSVCGNRCGYPCVPCRMPCMWKCEHYECTKRCGETCDREKCNEPCRKPLKCGHQCAGICGDFCPRLCRICDKDKLQTIFLGNEDEPNALYVELVDCGHVFEVSDLDYWMEGMKDKSVAIQLKVCPRCKTPIRRSLRYGNIVKKTLADIEKVKKIKLDELERLQEKKNDLKERVNTLCIKYGKFVDYRLDIRVRDLRSNADAYTTIENQIHFLDCLGKIDEKFFDGSKNAKFVARSSKLVSEMERIRELLHEKTLLTTQELKDISENISFLSLSCQFQFVLWEIEQKDGCNLSEEIKSSIDTAKRIMSRQDNACSTTLAITDDDRAIVASVIDQVNQKLDPIASLTPEEHAGILKAFNFSKKGHWYKCPNDHIYVITECGGAMQKGVCPECQEEIGGGNHRLVEGNQVATEMDGARHGAWSEQANLENYDQDELRRLQR